MKLLDINRNVVAVDSQILVGLCRGWSSRKFKTLSEYSSDKRHVYTFTALDDRIRVTRSLASYVLAGYESERRRWESRVAEVNGDMEKAGPEPVMPENSMMVLEFSPNMENWIIDPDRLPHTLLPSGKKSKADIAQEALDRGSSI